MSHRLQGAFLPNHQTQGRRVCANLGLPAPTLQFTSHAAWGHAAGLNLETENLELSSPASSPRRLPAKDRVVPALSG
jgi:hypothetical protein